VRTQLVVLARNSFSTKHQIKHTSFQKTNYEYVQTPLLAFETKLGRAPNSKKFFLNAGREDMLHSLSAGTPLLSATRSMRTLFSFSRIGYIH